MIAVAYSLYITVQRGILERVIISYTTRQEFMSFIFYYNFFASFAL